MRQRRNLRASALGACDPRSVCAERVAELQSLQTCEWFAPPLAAHRQAFEIVIVDRDRRVQLIAAL